ncbi:hypothetical protein CDAR_496121 [Caerostris darwini]|uniref:Uncharacterized protein n=1 Tax=Caerostris darwini TaxID=1538125 RepID=A0AAV4U1W5_9ARAC|nr:hypothetical protein CDAR_496121 [Caerostris darwini]
MHSDTGRYIYNEDTAVFGQLHSNLIKTQQWVLNMFALTTQCHANQTGFLARGRPFPAIREKELRRGEEFSRRRGVGAGAWPCPVAQWPSDPLRPIPPLFDSLPKVLKKSTS